MFFPSSFDYHVTIYLIFEKTENEYKFGIQTRWYNVRECTGNVANASEDDICKYMSLDH